MKVYQISLYCDAYDARGKSWEDLEAETGCKPDIAWLDPIHNRRLLKAEFGCSVSHLRVWQKIAKSGVSGIILEEDAVFSSFDVSEIEGILKSHHSVWLGYRENNMGYWYNAHAYAITPTTALELINGFSDAIIPADEWLPLKLKGSFNYFYRPEIVKQIPRSQRPSTIEEDNMTQNNKKDFRIVTVATEQSKMWALEQSAEKYGVKVVNLGKDHPWRDEMTGLAGMPKIQLVNEYLATAPDDAIILYLDGYDTFFADEPLNVLERYHQMGADIVFGAEDECWPDKNTAHKWGDTGTKYKYLNSGCYIGTVKALHHFISLPITEPANGDDQLYCQQRYHLVNTLDGFNGYKVVLDFEAYIFQNHDKNVKVINNQLWNTETSCCGCIYHGNGGNEAKEYFVEMASIFGFTKSDAEIVSPYYLTLDYKEVAKDILVTDFLTENQCKFLIDKSESRGNWGAMEGDKFPAQEIRLRDLGLWHEYERLWHEKLGKISEKFWPPMEHYGLRDAFTMRYTTDTQTSLALHTDASLVTGSVKLNSNYEGAELIFPRQDFSNIKVKNGQCILFPAQVTHGHYVNELKSGVKYSLTMWTSRYSGDVND
tara:strand:- start:3567 stop:5360 length:1794 start_codon:yes stop_codon:yes gene_type:complete